MSTDLALEGTAVRPSARPFRLIALALGELRRSYASFLIMIACIALGVAVIAGVGALSDGLNAGFARQGEVLLGGDVTLARPHRQATPEERRWLAAQGRMSETATLRSMARRADGTEQVLVEVKGVDRAYPLAGELQLEGGVSGAKVLAEPGGAIVEPILLARLGLAMGDEIQLGRTKVVIRGLLAVEPDRIADRITVGPRVLIALATLEASGLAEPGSLVQWRYALKLDGAHDRDTLQAFRGTAAKALPEAGFAINDRFNPSPSLTRTLTQLRQFLTLIGLSSLMIGGIGVASAVAAYIERRRKVIAAMRSLGASSRQIFTLHLTQVLALALVGIAIGLGIGLLVPAVLSPLIAAALPVRIGFAASPASLGLAAAYGLLVVLLFSLWPLGRAGNIRAAALFRDEVAPQSRRPPWVFVGASVAVAVALVAVAIATADRRQLAIYFCVGIAAVLVIFPALGALIAWLAARVRRPRSPALALALGAIAAPGGLTRSVVLSLGAGLSLLTGVALVDAAIVGELGARLPKNSPDYFLLDIPPAEMASLAGAAGRALPETIIEQAPMLRGRIVALGKNRAEDLKPPPEASWVLRGDRGLTYADELPAGSRIVAGSWWPPNYNGEPLVSFEAELARHLKLEIGDTVTVNVLGRNITARIANLREVHWENLGINFVMVFSPNVLKGAPHNLMATMALPKGTSLAAEADLMRDIGKAHPALTIIRIKDAIVAFNTIFQKAMTAIRVAGSVTLLAGGLVLAGAFATAQRRRMQLAVILKAIGGTRRRILAMHLAEYLILAAATAVIAAVVGTLGAWAVLHYLLKIDFLLSWAVISETLALAVGLVVAVGLVGSARILAAPAVPYLRSE